MKKFMKTCIITASILLLAGIVLAVTAGALRGNEKISEVVEKVTGGWVDVHWNDVKDWGVAVVDKVESVADTIDDTGAYYDLQEATMFEHSYKLYKGDVSKYCPGEGITKLDIEAGGCVLETRASGDDRFYIEVENANKFQGYVKDDTLHIKASSGAKSWSRKGSTAITLYVPENFGFESAKIELGAGVMELSDLYAEEISFQVGAGQIIVEGIVSSGLEVEIGAGEIRLVDMEAEKLSAEIGMGNFTAQGSASGDVEIECGMGNVNLELSGGEKSFNYSIECAMGNVDLGGSSYSGIAKEKNIQNGALKNMDIECAMGNVSIIFEN